jgi:MFS family permease
MKYDEFEEENFNVDTLAITRRIDNLQYGKWHLFVILCLGYLIFIFLFNRKMNNLSILGVTWVFDGYEVSMLSLATLDLQADLNISSIQIGYIASAYLIGCCIGALFFGYMASRFGRKALFSITLLIYLISIIVQSFMPGYVYLLACRLFTGATNEIDEIN